MTMTQTLYYCATCQPAGITDEDPKVHYGPDRYHYGCLPPGVKADLLGDNTTAQQLRLAIIISAAEHGLRAELLREHVVITVAAIPDDPSEVSDHG